MHIEVLLLTGEIRPICRMADGVFGACKVEVTFDDGTRVHKCHAIMKDDHPEQEVLAYTVSKALGFHMVPPTVSRRLTQDYSVDVVNHYGEGTSTRDFSKGSVVSLQLFVPDAKMGRSIEYTSAPKPADYATQRGRLDLLDQILGNYDRHGSNWLWKDNRIIAIDHGLCYGTMTTINLPWMPKAEVESRLVSRGLPVRTQRHA